MTVFTRIGLGCFSRDGIGSVELPESETLYCPQCGTKVNDKGDCKASFGNAFDGEGIAVARIIIDCRVCGCCDREPAIFPKED